MEKLRPIAKMASEKISEYSRVRLISHNDADGITAAAVMCHALLREDIVFHASIVSRLDENVVETVNNSTDNGDLVLFCDMGSGQPELIEKVRNDTIIIDHHAPVGDTTAQVMVNPHLADIDGAYYMCASTTAYVVATEMNPENKELAGLAIAGAIGDKQLFDRENGLILKEGIENGSVSIRKGLKVGDGDLAEVLERTPEPYLDITGEKEKIANFLNILGISGPIEELDENQMKKLTSAVALKLTKRASPEAIDASIGEVCILNHETIPNVYDMVTLLNCCGKLERGGLALTACLRDEKAAEEGWKIAEQYQQVLMGQIKKAEKKIQKRQHLRYIQGEDMEATGMIAGVVIRYIHPDLPFIALNKVDDVVKISGRGTRKLVDGGLDLAVALREAASGVGGSGGGHNIASGAAIPPGSEDEFLKALDAIIAKQLGNNADEN